MNIYLVRHGETDLNVSGVFYGHIDCDINEKGKKQAYRVGEFLKDIKFDFVYTSPLKRAKHTAEIILGINKFAPKSFVENESENESENADSFQFITDIRLKEIGFGIWESLSVNEIISLDKDFWEEYFKGWPNVAPPSGESFMFFLERVKSFFNDIIDIRRSDDKTNILIVAHHGPLALMPVFALNLNVNDYWKFKIDQGVYSLISTNKNGSIIKKEKEYEYEYEKEKEYEYVLKLLNCSR